MNLSANASYKKRIAARFDKASLAYESHARVQSEIVRRVAALVQTRMNDNETWCDFGSGSATLLEHLNPLPHKTQFVCLDISHAMLLRAKKTGRTKLAINADIDFMPLRDNVFAGASLISTLQWSVAFENALKNIAKTIRRGGRFCFSIFTRGSFFEITELRKRMGFGASLCFPAENELLAALTNAGFEIDMNNMEHFQTVQTFASAREMLKSMNKIGVTATEGPLMNRATLRDFCNEYERLYSADGGVSVTYKSLIGSNVNVASIS